MKKCPHCAEDIQDAAVVCKHCHRDIPPTPPPQVQTTPNGPAWARYLVYAILGIGALTLLSAFFTNDTATPPETTAVAGPVSLRNPTASQLAGFVQSVGEESCPAAKRSFFQGINEKGETWNVECSTGKSFVVSLENSGTVRVLACSVLQTVSKVECFKTFDEQRVNR